jgi:hypothetical protein
MSNNKQSSVEWLQAIELERDLTLADWNKAKEMHRREHADTARDWWVEGTSDARKASTGRYESFDDYYSKKFTSEQPTQD